MPSVGKVVYPFVPFGWDEGQQPKQENILIKNATVWTNEKEGVMQNADVLIKNGKITAVGKNLSDASARVIDGTGKHVTPVSLMNIHISPLLPSTKVVRVLLQKYVLLII